MFSAYLVFSLIESSVPLLFARGTDAYGYSFLIFKGVGWLFQVLITLELFTLILGRYPGIASLGARLVKTSSAIALIAALLSVTVANATHQYPLLDRFYLVSRVVYLSIFLFVVLMVSFLIWFPVPLSRNAVRYVTGYAVYLGAKVAAFFTINLFGTVLTGAVSNFLLSIDVACLIYWAATFRHFGEEIALTIGHSWNPHEEARLIGQLESINASLLRTSRR